MGTWLPEKIFSSCWYRHLSPDAWCGSCRSKIMWAITRVNAEARYGRSLRIIHLLIITARNLSRGNVMFLQGCVILFTGEGASRMHPRMPPSECTPWVHPLDAPPRRQTANRRAVCIVLEWILVDCSLSVTLIDIT